MRVVVTGGHGFIGDHVVSELKGRGFEAEVLDRHFGLDVRNIHDVHKTMKGADGVIHLAGVLGTAELFESPQHAIQVNIGGGTNVILEALRANAVFVNITMPHVWNNIYQATKKAVEDIATAYHEYFGLKCVNVRGFNVFGTGQKVGSPQKIIPTFSNLGWRKKPLPVWGDGEQKVDLVHVTDVARVLVDALQFEDNRTIDAGTGTGFSVLDIAEAVHVITDSGAGVEHLPMRKGERYADVVAKGEGWDDLGWHPVFAYDDLVQTVESYRVV